MALQEILLVDCLRTDFLIALLGLMLSASIVAIAIATALSQDIDTGLTIGSYVLALAALVWWNLDRDKHTRGDVRANCSVVRFVHL